jgi:Spy/CpxP family protein refolding chaperone
MNQIRKTLLLTAMLTVTPMAMAGPGHAGHGGPGPGDSTSQLAREMAGAIKRLDLSEEQETAIRALFSDNRETLKAHGQASREVRDEIRELLGAERLDEDALAALATREGELAEERVILMTTLASQVHAELTEAQRAELAQMRDDRLARRDEMRRERLDRRQP